MLRVRIRPRLADGDGSDQTEAAHDSTDVEDADLTVTIEIRSSVKTVVASTLPVRGHKAIEVGLVDAVVAIEVALAELVGRKQEVFHRVWAQ